CAAEATRTAPSAAFCRSARRPGTPAGGECAPPSGSPRHLGTSSRLLRRDRNGEPLAALGPPSLEDVATPRGRHPSEEAVRALAAGVTRLKSSLHEVPAYPSQRLTAVNLLTQTRRHRRHRRPPCPWRGLHTSIR